MSNTFGSIEIQSSVVKWQLVKRESFVREKLVREQSGRLHANLSGLGRTCCKRERYAATEPVRLTREDCICLLLISIFDTLWYVIWWTLDQAFTSPRGQLMMYVQCGILDPTTKSTISYACTYHYACKHKHMMPHLHCSWQVCAFLQEWLHQGHSPNETTEQKR